MKKNEFLIMRHSYDDHSYIDGKNDTSLTPKGVQIAKDAAEKILFKLDGRDIVVRYSVKKRAQETAEILCERISKEGIKINLVEDNGLTELYQGKFDFTGLTHQQRVDFLQSCWDDFESLRHQGELRHHFGEFKDRNILLQPGEDHVTWSIRVGKAVLNILSDLRNENQSINVTHRGATLEIQNIIRMANNIIQTNQVEQYETVQMLYCQDYLFAVNDLDAAEDKVRKFLMERERDL